MLEDSPKNIEAIRGGETTVVVRDWPYNRHLPGGIPRVSSVGEYLAMIAREENL